MTAIRAILIDPRERRVTEVSDDFNNLSILKQYLAQGSRGPLLAALGTMASLGRGVHGYCDDDGHFRDDQRFWAFSDTSGNPYVVPGYCLMLGVTEDGSECDLPADVTTAAVFERVIWFDDPDEARSHVPPHRMYVGGQLVKEEAVEFDKRVPYGKVA